MGKSPIKLLFVSRPSAVASQIKVILEKNPKYQVISEKTASEAMSHLSVPGIYSLILLTEKVNLRHFNLIEQIRSLGHKFQILIFAEEEPRSVSILVEKLYGVTVIGVSQIDLLRDLGGLFTRFLTDTHKFKRVSKRHATSQKIAVKNLTTGSSFIGNASNMSAHGAQVEINSGLIKLADRLKLVIYLDKLKKTHSLDGLVVWIKSSPLGKKVVGVSFVKKKKRL